MPLAFVFAFSFGYCIHCLVKAKAIRSLSVDSQPGFSVKITPKRHSCQTEQYVSEFRHLLHCRRG